MKAVITVIGKDTVGILAGVAGECAKHSANVIEVTQSVMNDMFAMIMMVDITNCTVPFKNLAESLKEIGKEYGVMVHVTHEELFNTMYRV
ncbi:MAG: ACT domain-containing protein [Clostridia bacterium]|nr:ACT domain-containing protein [Clostridia bacterium]